MVDSGILIDHLRGRPEARGWILAHEASGLAISVIARAEVLSGMLPNEREATLALLARFPALTRLRSPAGG